MNDVFARGCGSPEHLTRRTLLKAAGLGGICWLTPLAEQLARATERSPRARAKSVIVLWLQGGPSQLETFDPHPNTRIGGDTRAIRTAARGVKIASVLEQTAEQMDAISLVRAVTTKEGDHERATYNVKTGFRPDPTLQHPAIGSVVCHQLSDDVEIPRHVSILPSTWPARGGYLGDQYDAFKIDDPSGPVPDVARQVSPTRFDRRLKDLREIVEPEFARGRLRDLDRRKTLHGHSISSAQLIMDSDKLKAFNVNEAPRSLRRDFGDTPFGRGCLAALRLVEVGVRCVEVTLGGWDSHANNHDIQMERAGELDPALATLIRELRQRDMLDQTVVLCGGEFGRTPRINAAAGRDHWPHGFTIAMAGGGLRGGHVVGATAPEPRLDENNRLQDISKPHSIADVHATVLRALGIDYEQSLDTPVERPMQICEGRYIEELLRSG